MKDTNVRKPPQKLINAYRIHTISSEHGNKTTPAENAGIKLNLGDNKIESLIRLASCNEKKC